MRGFTLPEVLVSATLMLLLTVVLATAWVQGARSWNYASRLSARFHQLVAVRHRLEKDLLNSNSRTVDVEPAALAFASAQADAEHYVRVEGMPVWQKYFLYYRSGPTLARREITAPAGAEGGLTECDFGTGPHALSYYAGAGQVQLDAVSDFQVSREGSVVHVELECRQVFYTDRERAVRLTSSTRVRN